jgi:serine palmitoyltransferase
VKTDGYAPLTHDFESFYERRLYKRIHDCWNRPVNSCPGTTKAPP